LTQVRETTEKVEVIIDENLSQVADDPETLRIKQNTKNFSNVAYHGDIQKKAVMERQREMTEIVDNRGKKFVESFDRFCCRL
jgi:Nebulin repeat